MTYTGLFKVSGEAVDIPTMRDMTASEYAQHLDGALFFVDHHGVLRSAVGEFPLAVTRAQFSALMQHLSSLRDTVGA